MDNNLSGITKEEEKLRKVINYDKNYYYYNYYSTFILIFDLNQNLKTKIIAANLQNRKIISKNNWNT